MVRNHRISTQNSHATAQHLLSQFCENYNLRCSERF
jgi:hypothetical protein